MTLPIGDVVLSYRRFEPAVVDLGFRDSCSSLKVRDERRSDRIMWYVFFFQKLVPYVADYFSPHTLLSPLLEPEMKIESWT